MKSGQKATRKITPPDGGERVFQVFTEIGIINQLISAELQHLLGRRIGMSEFSVLNHCVRVGDGSTPSYLARVFQMTKASMTAIIAKLVAKKLIRIEQADHDKRLKIVRITEQGRSAHDWAIRAMQPTGRRIDAAFGAQRLAGMLPALSALRVYLDAARNERDGLGPSQLDA